MQCCNFFSIKMMNLQIVFSVFLISCNPIFGGKGKDYKQEKTEAIQILQSNLITQSEWVKVHSAEFLLWTGHPEGIKDVFLEEEKKFGKDSPYRIGIWRVLAQAETKAEEKEKWIQKILQAFTDENGKDRVHAAETLAKLRISPLKDYPDITQRAMEAGNKSLSLYTRWSNCYVSLDSLKSVRDAFLELIFSKEKNTHKPLAAYVIRQSGILEEERWTLLAQSALSEPKDSDIRINLLNTAFVCVDKESIQSDLFKQVYKEFLKYRNMADNNIRIKLADGLAENGHPEDIMLLSSFLKINDSSVDPISADLRAFVSYAILRICNRWKLN